MPFEANSKRFLSILALTTLVFLFSCTRIGIRLGRNRRKWRDRRDRRNRWRRWHGWWFKLERSTVFVLRDGCTSQQRSRKCRWLAGTGERVSKTRWLGAGGGRCGRHSGWSLPVCERVPKQR